MSEFLHLLEHGRRIIDRIKNLDMHDMICILLFEHFLFENVFANKMSIHM